MAKSSPHNQNRCAHGPIVSREKYYFLKVFLILWKNEMESPIFLHDEYDLYDVCFHLNIYTATFLFDWWLLCWPEIWHWIFLPIQVSQYVLWDLISRYHCLDPTNRDISGLHCNENFSLVRFGGIHLIELYSSHWVVNIDSGTKPLPEPMLTKIYDMTSLRHNESIHRPWGMSPSSHCWDCYPGKLPSSLQLILRSGALRWNLWVPSSNELQE